MIKLVVKRSQEFVEVFQGICGFCTQGRTVAVPVNQNYKGPSGMVFGICDECATQVSELIEQHKPIEGQV